MGFRRFARTQWFALSRDPNHPSRKLDASNDCDSLDPEESEWQSPFPDQIKEVAKWTKDVEVTESEIIAELEEILPPDTNDPAWLSTNEVGRTLLHCAVESRFLPMVVRFLLSKKPQLAALRDMHGNTALDLVQEKMNEDRKDNWYTFEGFGPETVDTLGALTGQEVLSGDHFGTYFDLDTVTASQDLINSALGRKAAVVLTTIRFQCGCSCGVCINGYLSPRMRFQLLKVAESEREGWAASLPDEDTIGWMRDAFGDDLVRIFPTIFPHGEVGVPTLDFYRAIVSL